MKILGELKTRKVESEYVRPIKQVICDKCGKELTDLYALITTQHSLWGNDSYESYKKYDLCFECCKKLFNDYLEKPNKTETFEYKCVSANIVVGAEIEMDENGNIYFDDRNEFEIGEFKK